MNHYLNSFKNTFNFTGRARRKEFWIFIIINSTLSALMNYDIKTLHYFEQMHVYKTIFDLLIAIPTISVFIRRMHDIEKSGWYIVIPFYNLYLALLNGTSGDNNYGADPKSEN